MIGCGPIGLGGGRPCSRPPACATVVASDFSPGRRALPAGLRRRRRRRPGRRTRPWTQPGRRASSSAPRTLLKLGGRHDGEAARAVPVLPWAQCSAPPRRRGARPGRWCSSASAMPGVLDQMMAGAPRLHPGRGGRRLHGRGPDPARARHQQGARPALRPRLHAGRVPRGAAPARHIGKVAIPLRWSPAPSGSTARRAAFATRSVTPRSTPRCWSTRAARGTISRVRNLDRLFKFGVHSSTTPTELENVMTRTPLRTPGRRLRSRGRRPPHPAGPVLRAGRGGGQPRRDRLARVIDVVLYEPVAQSSMAASLLRDLQARGEAQAAVFSWAGPDQLPATSANPYPPSPSPPRRSCARSSGSPRHVRGDRRGSRPPRPHPDARRDATSSRTSCSATSASPPGERDRQPDQPGLSNREIAETSPSASTRSRPTSAPPTARSASPVAPRPSAGAWRRATASPRSSADGCDRPPPPPEPRG